MLRSAPQLLVQPSDVVERRLAHLREVLGLTPSPTLERVRKNGPAQNSVFAQFDVVVVVACVNIDASYCSFVVVDVVGVVLINRVRCTHRSKTSSFALRKKCISHTWLMDPPIDCHRSCALLLCEMHRYVIKIPQLNGNIADEDRR